MTILVAEKNKHTLNTLTDMLKQQSDDTVLSFPDSPSALAAARSQEIDTAFLDVALPEIDGLLLGRYLKDLNPNINLIMMTTKRADAFDAMTSKRVYRKAMKMEAVIEELKNSLTTVMDKYTKMKLELENQN